jgi:mRNA interferase RelE/StbE
MYNVRVLRQVLKDIADLPKDYVRLVGRHIDDLAQDPRPPGVLKLQGETGYRLRVGVYRILYEIDDEPKPLRFIASSIDMRLIAETNMLR